MTVFETSIPAPAAQSAIANRQSAIAALSLFARDIKLTHTVFAMPFALLSAPIRLTNRIALRRETKKYLTITDKNASAVQAINSTDLLLGRTLIVRVRKPA